MGVTIENDVVYHSTSWALYNLALPLRWKKILPKFFQLEEFHFHFAPYS